MTNSFYVELSSNEKNYEQNTVANFKNRIQLIENLEGRWEVGLVEISYPKNWKTLKSNHALKLYSKRFHFLSMIPTTIENYSFNKTRLGILRAGYYDTIVELFEELNKEMEVFKDDDDEVKLSLPKFELDEITKLVKIIPGEMKNGDPILPMLDKELMRVLGFDEYNVANINLTINQMILAQRPADIHVNLKTLYVYSDIVVPQYVGDTRCKLLRTVGVPSDVKYDEQIVISYENPHYVDVLTNEFEYIEIDIKDDLNERVPFMHGRSRVKLHFRRKNEQSL